MRFVVLTAAAVAAMTMTATAGAHLFRPGCNSRLAPRVELRCARLNRQHALATIEWARTTERRVQLVDAYSALILGRVIVNHRWLYRTMSARVREAQTRLARAALPAHHLLWLCIHGTPSLGTPVGHEASRWDTRAANGHYGGLQMHPGWGEGTSYYASDDSQTVQERAAEKGYHDSGWSRTWLESQWGQTIGPCWRYAGS